MYLLEIDDLKARILEGKDRRTRECLTLRIAEESEKPQRGVPTLFATLLRISGYIGLIGKSRARQAEGAAWVRFNSSTTSVIQHNATGSRWFTTWDQFLTILAYPFSCRQLYISRDQL